MAIMIDHRPLLHGEALLWDKLKAFLPCQDIVYNNREIMRTGNVSHYVAVHPTWKKRKRGRYGKVFTPSYRDWKRSQSLADQVKDET